MSPLCNPLDDPGSQRLDPLSGQVVSALRLSSFLRHRLMMSIVPPDQVNPAQAGYLLVLEREEGVSQSDVASKLHVSRPTVTAMLQKMEAAGLLERRVDEHDQRITRIYLTDEGRAAATRLRDAHIEAIEATIGRMSEPDRKEFLRLLSTLNDTTLAALAERGVHL